MERLVRTTHRLSNELEDRAFTFHHWGTIPNGEESMSFGVTRSIVEDRRTGFVYQLDPSMIRFLSKTESAAVFQMEEEEETDRLVDKVTLRYQAARPLG